jgi:hypothetical protein
MRNLLSMSRWILVLPCLLGFWTTSAEAQQRKPWKIEQVRVGFQAIKSQTEYAFKGGAWAPVYVDITAWPDGRVPSGKLVIESEDGDGVRNRFTVTLPAMEPGELITVVGFTRPGYSTTKIQVTALLDDRTVTSLEEDFSALKADEHLYLTVGSRLQSLKDTLDPRVEENTNNVRGSRADRMRHGMPIDDVRMLPNRNFAYEAVDLMILTTGNREGFLTGLLNEKEGRKEAIVDWVRRGGRLVISAGRNQDIVAKLEGLDVLMPVTLKGTRQVDQLTAIKSFVQADVDLQNLPPKSKPGGQPPPIEIAVLEKKPGRTIDQNSVWSGDNLLIAHGSYGLGRVTVLAFDLDQPPFTTWGSQKNYKDKLKQHPQSLFWEKLLVQMGLPKPVEEDVNQIRGRIGNTADENDLAVQLGKNLEAFEDVPVISFGWVALFILLYIIVVGPLDYFFLKKVVKRLELTWITFPTVVITISVVAYFTAYWLKGNDQKVNKIDFVDIDLQTQQMYGNTWFTIFSPRIQHYTIGLEPSAPEWTPPPGPALASSVNLTWLTSKPEFSNVYGSRGGQSGGLFRRAYDYADDATGLRGVPIQVWSTKSFSSTWQVPLDPAKPAISADLKLTENKDRVTGTITSRLPVALESAYLCKFDGANPKFYPFTQPIEGNGRDQRVDNIFTENGIDLNIWQSQDPGAARPQAQPRRGGTVYPGSQSGGILKQMMFFGNSRNNIHDNVYRHLDQYWRLLHKNEIFLVGKVSRQEGGAEELTAGPSSPSRLWLGDLPQPKVQRPTMNGTLSQETYVRIVIPLAE